MPTREELLTMAKEAGFRFSTMHIEGEAFERFAALLSNQSAAEIAGLESAAGHLSQRVDEAAALAEEAIELMTRFHSHAQPDDTPDMNAVFPALHFRNFVDDHARLMFKLNQFQRDQVDPAFLRLKKAADQVCAVLGAHGQISARDDRVQTLMDCLYETDPLKSVYAALLQAQGEPQSSNQVWNEAIEKARNWLRVNANAEKDPAKRAAFIEAHNAVLSFKRPSQAHEPSAGALVTPDHDGAPCAECGATETHICTASVSHDNVQSGAVDELPPLPKTWHWVAEQEGIERVEYHHGHQAPPYAIDIWEPLYTPDQMREYAALSRAQAAPAQQAPVVSDPYAYTYIHIDGRRDWRVASARRNPEDGWTEISLYDGRPPVLNEADFEDSIKRCTRYVPDADLIDLCREIQLRALLSQPAAAPVSEQAVPISQEPKDAGGEFIEVRKRLPKCGQRIQGLSLSGAWIETFDPNEPLGNMTHWRAAGDDESASGAPASDTMTIDYELGGRFWHRDCKKARDGIMRVVSNEEASSTIECMHCGKRGYYPVGSVGSVTVSAAPSNQSQGGDKP